MNATIAPPVDETVSVDSENPWPGLASFQEADHSFFHGREHATEELLRLVRRDRLTVLFAASGLGKTSLLQAGLFPQLRLRGDTLPVYIRLDYAPGSPRLTTQVYQALLIAAASEGIEVPVARAVETLWEYFHRLDANLWTARNRVVLPVLVFDQFEEILTIGRNAPEAATAGRLFLEELSDLVEGRPPDVLTARLEQDPHEAELYNFERHHYRVVLSLREDFLPELDSLQGRMRTMAQNRLRPLSGGEALRVLNDSGAHLLAEGVGEAIVRFVAGANAATPLAGLEVEPALLSLVSRELNTKRIQRGQPQITHGLLEGSRTEILSDFYERSLEGLPRAVRVLVEDRLLTRSGYRESMAYEDALAVPDVTAEAIRQLVNRRLLRLEDRSGVTRVELTHDVLASVVVASRDSRRAREETESANAARIQAEAREAEMRRQLRRNRVLTVSAAAIALASAMGIAVSMIFVVPTLQLMSSAMEWPLLPFTRVFLAIFRFVADFWWAGALLLWVISWAGKRWGRAQQWRQVFASLLPPILVLLTIVSLSWIIIVSIEYAMIIPALPSRFQRVNELLGRHAQIEMLLRTERRDSAIVLLNAAISDPDFERTKRVATYYRLLLAETYAAKHDSVRAKQAYVDALKRASSYFGKEGLEWQQLIEQSRNKTLLSSPRAGR